MQYMVIEHFPHGDPLPVVPAPSRRGQTRASGAWIRGELGHGGLPALLPDHGVRGPSAPDAVDGALGGLDRVRGLSRGHVGGSGGHRRASTLKLASPSVSRPRSVDEARWPPASLVTLVTGREDPRTPVLHTDEAPRFPPDATIFRVERMGMAHFGRNALAALGAHRAERGIGFGSKLRSLLGHCDSPAYRRWRRS